MITREDVINRTQDVVVEALARYFLTRDVADTTHPVLGIVWPEEYAYRQALGGIETSFGTQLWERLTERLAPGGGFEVMDPATALLRPDHQHAAIAQVLDDFNERRNEPGANLPMSELIARLSVVVPELPSRKGLAFRKGDGIDTYLRRGDDDYAIDIKTVQMNAGAGPTFSRRLALWHSYFMQMHDLAERRLHARIVLPYDPCIGSDWWTRFGGRAYPLDRDDVLIGNDYWALITGNDEAWDAIEESFRGLRANPRMEVIQRNLVNRSPSFEDRVALIEIGRGLALRDSYSGALASSSRASLTWECRACGAILNATLRQVATGARQCETCVSTGVS